MVEKNNREGKSKIILIILLSFILLLSSFSLFRWYKEGVLLGYLESWILLSSRGYYGDTTPLTDLRGFPFYALELLGDTSYRRGDRSGAITAYTEALKIHSDNIIELKVALLKLENTESGNEMQVQTGSINPELDASISRIEKDAKNREKYFGKGENYTNSTPFFETRDKEVIDW